MAFQDLRNAVDDQLKNNEDGIFNPCQIKQCLLFIQFNDEQVNLEFTFLRSMILLYLKYDGDTWRACRLLRIRYIFVLNFRDSERQIVC